MQVTAKLDYALRALIELAMAAPERRTRDQVAEAQSVPPKYLESILTSLRQAGFVHSQRGPDGGFELADLIAGRLPDEIESLVADDEAWRPR